VEIVVVDLDRTGGVQWWFHVQKNLLINDLISRHAMGDILCPVASWMYVYGELTRIDNVRGVAVNVFVGKEGNIVYSDTNDLIKTSMANMHEGVTSPSITQLLREVRSCIGMHLSGTPVVELSLQGCLSSDEFVVYVQRQVLEHSTGIFSNIIQHDDFMILPPRPSGTGLHGNKNFLSYRSSQKHDRITSPALHLSC